MKSNAAMDAILPEVSRVRQKRLPEPLERVVSAGLVVCDDCLLLRNVKTATPFDATFQDKTGYECFVNHLHVGGDKTAATLADLLEFCRRVKAEAPPQFALRFIIAHEEDWTVRFHSVRPGEQWQSDDLEGYQGAALLVLDSTDALLTTD